MMRILAISGGEWRQLMIKTGALIWRKLLLRTNVAGITGSFGKTLVGAGNDTRRVARVAAAAGLFAKNLYHALPPRLRNAADPFVISYRLLRRLRPEVWIVTGEEQGSHLPLSVCIYAATSQDKNYLFELIFGSTFQACYLGRTWLWNVFRTIPQEASGCSMVFAEVHQSHLELIGPGGMVIPTWMSAEINLPRPRSVMKSNSVLCDLRKIRDNALECGITRDEQRFDDFYQNMYLPYVKGRYGNCALLPSREILKSQLDDGNLILVKKKGEYISGMLLNYGGARPSLRVLGVRDGNRDLVRDGAISAAFEFSLEHLETKGCRKVNPGPSRAFLHDGVLRFKRKWSQTISPSMAGKFLMKVTYDTAATRAFLQNNPFIFERFGQLRGAVFLNGGSPPAPGVFQEMSKEHFHSGLSELIVCCFAPSGGAPGQETELNPGAVPHRHLSPADRAHLIGGLGSIAVGTTIAIHWKSDSQRPTGNAGVENINAQEISSG